MMMLKFPEWLEKNNISDYELIVMTDGNICPQINFDKVFCEPKADAKYHSVMGASILAKVCRDKIMLEMDKKYPAPLASKTISDDNGVKYEAIIDETITTSFAVRTVTVEGGKFIFSKGAAVYVVTEGEGSVIGENYNRELKKGDYFLLPENAKDKYSLTGNYIKVTECFA
jgi:quercetin dioxygenase-like cupin family protein